MPTDPNPLPVRGNPLRGPAPITLKSPDRPLLSPEGFDLIAALGKHIPTLYNLTRAIADHYTAAMASDLTDDEWNQLGDLFQQVSEDTEVLAALCWVAEGVAGNGTADSGDKPQ